VSEDQPDEAALDTEAESDAEDNTPATAEEE
jgi:hypothetical protein